MVFLQKSMQILLTDKALPTTRRIGKILGGRCHHWDRKWCQLACLFHHPDSTLCWLVLYCCSACQEGVWTSHSWDDIEFASWPSSEWHGSHPWAITCSTGVQSFCIQWHSGVTKMHTAPEKCYILRKNLQWASLLLFFYPIKHADRLP